MPENKVKVVTWFHDTDEAKTLFVDYFPSYQVTEDLYLTVYDHNHAAIETLVESEKFPGCFEYGTELMTMKAEAVTLQFISDLETMSAAEFLNHCFKYKRNFRD